MVTSAILFGFTLTRPFAIGAAVVCCSFYLYFGVHNSVLASQNTPEDDDEQALLAHRTARKVAADESPDEEQEVQEVRGTGKKEEG